MLEFATKWRQWQHFSYNERRLTDILRQAQGTLGHAFRANNETVRAIAGIHSGGAPQAAAQDPTPDITLSWNHRTYHVRLNRYGGIIEVTG